MKRILAHLFIWTVRCAGGLILGFLLYGIISQIFGIGIWNFVAALLIMSGVLGTVLTIGSIYIWAQDVLKKRK